MNIQGLECGVGGYYTFEMNGVPVFEAPSKNLITNFGWDRFMNLTNVNATTAQIQLGTSNTPPAVTDTALGALLVSLNHGASNTSVATSGTDAVGTYRGQRMSFSFAQGAVIGNLAEVGYKVQAADASLSSRSLIKDGLGNPAVIVATAIDQLTVTYELRYYLNRTLSTTGSITVAGTPTTWTLMAAADAVGVTADLNVYGMTPVRLLGNATGPNESYVVGNTFSMGAVGTNPSGTQVAIGSAISLTGVVVNVAAGTVTSTFTLGTGVGNTGTGIFGMRLAWVYSSNNFVASMGVMKLSFSPAIPKDNTKTLAVTITVTYVRV
jgi:hypothetical protein